MFTRRLHDVRVRCTYRENPCQSRREDLCKDWRLSSSVNCRLKHAPNLRECIAAPARRSLKFLISPMNVLDCPSTFPGSVRKPQKKRPNQLSLIWPFNNWHDQYMPENKYITFSQSCPAARCGRSRSQAESLFDRVHVALKFQDLRVFFLQEFVQTLDCRECHAVCIDRRDGFIVIAHVERF